MARKIIELQKDDEIIVLHPKFKNQCLSIKLASNHFVTKNIKCESLKNMIIRNVDKDELEAYHCYLKFYDTSAASNVFKSNAEILSSVLEAFYKEIYGPEWTGNENLDIQFIISKNNEDEL